jgi:hypothetical protein
MPSAWNNFVKKIYHAGKAENSSFTFGEALKAASKRKHEMNGGNADMPAEVPVSPSEAATAYSPAPVMAEPVKVSGGKSRKSKTSNKRAKCGGKTRKSKKSKK